MELEISFCRWHEHDSMLEENEEEKEVDEEEEEEVE